MKLRLLLITFLTYITASACLNIYYGIDDEGNLHITERTHYERKLNKNFNLERIAGKLPRLEEKLVEKGDWKDLSDYAIYLMKAGQFEVSLELLRALYRAHPEEYKLASNLGTAWELNGEVDSAMVYINRGMELNANAHDGSEWVHMKVLETKKQLEEDSTYLENNTVLGLTDEEENDTTVRDQLWIQVTERFPFTRAGDPIMASLMVDLGDCFRTTALEYSLTFYQIASEYHGDSTEATLQLIKDTKNKLYGFEGIRPDPNHVMPPRHAMRWRVGFTNYNQMMDDNNEDAYEINWEEYNTNTDSLLAMVGLEKVIDPLPPAPVESVDETIEGSELGEEKSNNLIYLLLGGGVLVMIGMYFFLRKR